MKTGRWNGVVAAFITMSHIKDEIDWEWPGDKTTEAQSNYFWQGVVPTDKTNGETHTGLTDTFANFHDYTIDWQPDSLSFGIDGKTVRTIQRSSTVGADGVTRFPNTPSRVQFSIWPAGIDGTAKGTIDWAGGMIDWDSPDYKAAGGFYTLLESVTVKCTNAQKIDPAANITSYVFGGDGATDGKAKTAVSMNAPTVVYSNRTTLLKGAAGGSVRMEKGTTLVAAGVVALFAAGVNMLL